MTRILALLGLLAITCPAWAKIPGDLKFSTRISLAAIRTFSSGPMAYASCT